VSPAEDARPKAAPGRRQGSRPLLGGLVQDLLALESVEQPGLFLRGLLQGTYEAGNLFALRLNNLV